MTRPRPLTRQRPLPMAHVREHLRAQSFLIMNNRLLAPVNAGKDTLGRRHTEAVAAQQQRAGKALSPALDDPRQPNPHRGRSVAQRPRSPLAQGRYGPGMELFQVDTSGAFSDLQAGRHVDLQEQRTRH
jgi:hypothetical protein